MHHGERGGLCEELCGVGQIHDDMVREMGGVSVLFRFMVIWYIEAMHSETRYSGTNGHADKRIGNKKLYLLV